MEQTAESRGKAYWAALLRIGTKSASPAAVTPPPTTITSGLKVLITAPRPRPR